MPKERIAIVGMGIAGAILGHNLLKVGYEITIYNKSNPSCSSRVAAGMFNSIIPRRVTKSWMADELNPLSKSYYLKLEKELNVSFYNPKDILHVFEYNKEQNKNSTDLHTPLKQIHDRKTHRDYRRNRYG